MERASRRDEEGFSRREKEEGEKGLFVGNRFFSVLSRAFFARLSSLEA